MKNASRSLNNGEVTFAGRLHVDPRSDLVWARQSPDANVTMRALAVGLRRVLRRCAERVTWDRGAFEKGLATVPPDSMLVLAPTHRSYLDFLLLGDLCFEHPELGLTVPHIAAADDFAKIPVVGRVLERSRAFYIPRGTGKASQAVTKSLARVTEQGGSLMFFVEGQRSRARQQLPPKRGLLRGLQATGRSFTLLPVSISYDRVPEELSFDRELSGQPKRPMSLKGLLGWLAKAARRDIELGRIHIGFGEAMHLTNETEVVGLGAALTREQQHHTAVSDFHLRMFLDQHPLPGVTETWLREALIARGAKVIQSSLSVVPGASAPLRGSLQNQWRHWFDADALALYPRHPVVVDQVRRHGWLRPEAPRGVPDAPTAEVVRALYAPLFDHCDKVLETLTVASLHEGITARTVMARHPFAIAPIIDEMLAMLTAEEVLVMDEGGVFRWGPRRDLF